VGEIRSAWEIAQEKADKLGKLSPEEQKRQRESRCYLIGKSLAEKYLDQHNIRLLQDELKKCSGEDGALISQATLQRLIEVVDLRSDSELDRISQGILSLAKNEMTGKTVSKIKELAQEYRETEEEARQEIEKAGREILHQLRISGTAIGPINTQAVDEWQEKLNQSTRPFEERLNAFKQELSSNVRF